MNPVKKRRRRKKKVEKRKASEVVEEPETKKVKQTENSVVGENGAPQPRLFVNGLPFASTQESIGEIFQECG